MVAGVQIYHDPARAGGHDVVLGVPDLDDRVKELGSRGIDAEASTTPSGQFRLAVLTDPAGNNVILSQSLTDTPPAIERFTSNRTVAAPPATVFAFLSDPSNHQHTEPTDWVRDAVDTTLITGPGQTFAVNMYLEQAGGHYVMHNVVTAFERDRIIAWLPCSQNSDGELDAGGWWWRYDLASQNDGTRVTLTYDWSDTSAAMRAEIGGMPAVPMSFLDDSLASLDTAIRAAR
ncbi:SRPBCC family protein [Rhodococcus fascians]|nr:SRPBCC family protein [Rhodococcus fascians]MBY4114717.1 SRPBCC family protein [Rhodococcus fascians]